MNELGAVNFHVFCKRHKVTPVEQDELAFQLGAIRARDTYRMLGVHPNTIAAWRRKNV